MNHAPLTTAFMLDAHDVKLTLPKLVLGADSLDHLDAELEEFAMACSAFDVNEGNGGMQMLTTSVKVEITPTPSPTPTLDSSNNADANSSDDANCRHGRTSRAMALTADERRIRRNEKERQRLANVRDRVRRLREDVHVLQSQHDRLQAELEHRAQVDTHQQVALTSSESASATSLLQRYVALVKQTEQLQVAKQSLEASLRPLALKTAAISTMTAIESKFKLSHSVADAHALPPPKMPMLVRRRSRAGSMVHLDPIAVFESLLLSEPLLPVEAKALVEETCKDMMEALSRTDWTHQVEYIVGWRGGYLIDKTLLRFKVCQAFPGVSADQLMSRTWEMLTNEDGYRSIQPLTKRLQVLQKINEECWVVAISVGGALLRHSVLLVARALIHGGYLLTFRSLPLVRQGHGNVTANATRQQFVEHEIGGIYSYIYAWYNFQNRVTPQGHACEVIFGCSSCSGDESYLAQLRVELLSGITRWQSAVGFSQFVFAQAGLPAP